MQVTDELFLERNTARIVEDELRGAGSEVRRWLPPTKRGEEATSEPANRLSLISQAGVAAISRGNSKARSTS